MKSSLKFQWTFTKPMLIGHGKTVPPTGKTFTLIMCTVGHRKNGVMDEEYLSWDNQSYMKQIGVTPWGIETTRSWSIRCQRFSSATYTDAWRRIGEQTPRPKAILSASA